MAGTATATFSADVWTSASTIDASAQPWDFAVPVNQENRHRSKSRTSRKSRDRGSKSSRSSSLSKQIYGHEQSHFAPRGRRDASLSRKEFDSGGVQDTAATSHINGSRKSDIKDDEENDENWIHRDKLARIESEELQQAAILFQRRPGTGSTRGRGRSRDHHHGSVSGTTVISATHHEPLEPWPDLQEDQQNNTASAALAGGDDITEDERQYWDLRRPEEIAAERGSSTSSIYRNPGLRKSSSRIPIPTETWGRAITDEVVPESHHINTSYGVAQFNSAGLISSVGINRWGNGSDERGWAAARLCRCSDSVSNAVP